MGTFDVAGVAFMMMNLQSKHATAYGALLTKFIENL
jgi:hypothetical protein